jgi:DNA-binding HxlR family transcriptional regulator
MMNMNAKTQNYRSECALSSALDVIGDKWSLLIVRDMCLSKSKYGDFQASPEKIPTNILASRLKQLEASGIIEKTPYQQKPLRYEYKLTAKGADLLPVMQHLAIWAKRYIPECGDVPEYFITLTPEQLAEPGLVNAESYIG